MNPEQKLIEHDISHDRFWEVFGNLRAACEAGIKCIALLTPFPFTDDPIVRKAVSESADRADAVRAQLRDAIAEAKKLERDSTEDGG